jgi:hypothetical protein
MREFDNPYIGNNTISFSEFAEEPVSNELRFDSWGVAKKKYDLPTIEAYLTMIDEEPLKLKTERNHPLVRGYYKLISHGQYNGNAYVIVKKYGTKPLEVSADIFNETTTDDEQEMWAIARGLESLPEKSVVEVITGSDELLNIFRNGDQPYQITPMITLVKLAVSRHWLVKFYKRFGLNEARFVYMAQQAIEALSENAVK